MIQLTSHCFCQGPLFICHWNKKNTKEKGWKSQQSSSLRLNCVLTQELRDQSQNHRIEVRLKSALLRAERRRHNKIFRRCRLHSYSPNPHRTTIAILDLSPQPTGWRKQTARSRERTSCTLEEWTTCRFHTWIDSMGAGCGLKNLWWQHWLYLAAHEDRCCSPSKTKTSYLSCHTSHSRKNVPVWWRPTFRQLEQKTCQTDHLLLQNTPGQYLSWSMGLHASLRIYIRKLERKEN